MVWYVNFYLYGVLQLVKCEDQLRLRILMDGLIANNVDFTVHCGDEL